MKIIRLGDPHVKPSNIEESEALMEFVLNTYLFLKADRLEILGDLFDTHNIIRLEVLQFWHRWIKKLRKNSINTVILVGNHDLGGDYANDYSALHVFQHYAYGNVEIITEPKSICGIGYLPYIHDNKKFIEEANWLAESEHCATLVSHTTYQGSKFDNGMFAPDGVDPDLLDPRLTNLITGHIHSTQEFGRVWYPGTARWLSKSCANLKKGIWACKHDDDGKMLSREFISTESVCTPILSLIYKEGEERPSIPEKAKVYLELIGSSKWINENKGTFKGAMVSSQTTDVKLTKDRKSGKSLYEFLTEHYKTGNKKELIEYMKDRDLLV